MINSVLELIVVLLCYVLWDQLAGAAETPIASLQGGKDSQQVSWI